MVLWSLIAVFACANVLLLLHLLKNGDVEL